MATKRSRVLRPSSMEELLKSREKNIKANRSAGQAKSGESVNSLSLKNKQPKKKSPNTTPSPGIGLTVDKPRRQTPKERERTMLGLEPSEDESQMCVIDWAKVQRWKNRFIADYLHHSPNGGKRGKAEAGRFKAMGTRAGFPDLFLPIAIEPFNGLFIEMKAGRGTVIASQKAYHPLLIEEGYRVETCYSAEGAINLIKNYLGLKNDV